VDSKGRNGALMSEASIGSLQGVFATKCLGTNGTMAVFVCNMFDVAVAVSQGTDNSEVCSHVVDLLGAHAFPSPLESSPPRLTSRWAMTCTTFRRPRV
jgi:hypothetical protein